MSPSPPDRLWRLVSRIGFLVAPAGLNFVVSGTTWWLHDLDELTIGDRQLRPVGVRVPFEVEALQQNAALVRTLDALWVQRLEAGSPQLMLAEPRALRQRLAAVSVELPSLQLEPLALRTSALLSALRFCPEYHRARGQDTGYLFDLLENGLTLLAVDPVR